MNNQQLLSIRTHCMLYLAEKNELPVAAICVSHKDNKAPLLERTIGVDVEILGLSCMDEKANVYVPEGVFDSFSNLNDLESTEIALEYLFKTPENWGRAVHSGVVLTPLYADHKTLKSIGFCGEAGPNMKEICKGWFDEYVKNNSVPSLPGFSAMHCWLPSYMQSKCYVYAQAVSVSTGFPGVWIGADHFTHAAVLHPDGEMEDIWGKRPLRVLLSEATRNGFSGAPDISVELFQEVIRGRQKQVGMSSFKKEVDQATLVMKANPFYSHKNSKMASRFR